MPPVRVSNEECFTVRYATRPESIGTSALKLTHQGDEYLLSGDDLEYKATAVPGKDVEAVLVWDHEKQEYVLRMINYNLRASRVLKRPASSNASQKNPMLRVSRASPPQQVSTPINVPQSTLGTPESAQSDESDADDFGDFADELEGELEMVESRSTALGTAGAGVDDEEVSSEEE